MCKVVVFGGMYLYDYSWNSICGVCLMGHLLLCMQMCTSVARMLSLFGYMCIFGLPIQQF